MGGSARERPEAQIAGRGGQHGERGQAGGRDPSAPEDPLQAHHEELAHRDELEGVAGEERGLLGGRGLERDLPDREVGKVQGVAHAQDEEQPPRAPQGGGGGQGRAGQPGHEARGEQEAGRGGAVEDELQLVEALRLGGGRHEAVADVALHHDQGHQAAEGVDVDLAVLARPRAALREAQRGRHRRLGNRGGGRARRQTASPAASAACWTCFSSIDSGPAPTNSTPSPTTVLGTAGHAVALREVRVPGDLDAVGGDVVALQGEPEGQADRPGAVRSGRAWRRPGCGPGAPARPGPASSPGPGRSPRARRRGSRPRASRTRSPRAGRTAGCRSPSPRPGRRRRGCARCRARPPCSVSRTKL